MLKGQKTGGVTTAQPPKRRNSGTTKQVLFTVSQTGMNNGGLWYKGDALNEPVGMLDIVQIWSAYNSTVHGFTSDGVMECSMRATTQRYRMITGSRDDNMTCRIIWFTRFVLFPQCFRLPFRIWLTQLLFGHCTVETCHMEPIQLRSDLIDEMVTQTTRQKRINFNRFVF